MCLGGLLGATFDVKFWLQIPPCQWKCLAWNTNVRAVSNVVVFRWCTDIDTDIPVDTHRQTGVNLSSCPKPIAQQAQQDLWSASPPKSGHISSALSSLRRATYLQHCAWLLAPFQRTGSSVMWAEMPTAGGSIWCRSETHRLHESRR